MSISPLVASPLARKGLEVLRHALYLDQSSSVDELGCLFQWQEDKPLQHLKRHLADAYGVEWSFPSTNGTTILNVLALLTACPSGGRILINRDAHASAIAAMIHGDCHPTYFLPDYDSQLGLSLGPTLAGFKEALNRGPFDCIFLTSPNYYGIVGDLAEIVRLGHEHGIPVVVDAAHAPHFHFCNKLPPAAEDLGTDLVCQSTHKVGSALSQGSLLLINRAELVPQFYEHVNDLGFVSTSFSYPILASIELGVRQLVEEGETLWSQAIARADALRQSVGHIPGITCFGYEQAWKPGFKAFDPTRVTLDVLGTGLTGFEFKQQLNQKYIYPEMATLQHVLFLITPGSSDKDVFTLIQALRGIAESKTGRRLKGPCVLSPPRIPEMGVVPRVAKFARKQVVPISEAADKLSADTVSTYPPGVPIITAGEVTSVEVVEYLRYMRDNGAVLKGISDPTLRTFKILSI